MKISLHIHADAEECVNYMNFKMRPISVLRWANTHIHMHAFCRARMRQYLKTFEMVHEKAPIVSVSFSAIQSLSFYISEILPVAIFPERDSAAATW